LENEEEINFFGLEPTGDVNVSLNDGAGFELTTLFPIKQELFENEEVEPGDNADEKNLKKATRHKMKQEPSDSDAAPKYYILSYIQLFVDIILPFFFLKWNIHKCSDDVVIRRTNAVPTATSTCREKS